MAFSMNGSSGNGCEINVTPLIDVLLVLLIIFMVIVPLVPKGLSASIPQPAKSPNESAPPQTIVVQVADGAAGQLTYRINGETFAKAELEPKLAEIYAGREDKAMFLKADPDLEYSAIAGVIDLSRKAGVTQVGVMTPRSEAGR